jgi:hypothetical protein
VSAGPRSQRDGDLRRLIDVGTDHDSQAERDAERPYADNLMGGYVPEEDGVDHRVEPKLWLTDGSEEGAPGGSKPAQSTSGDLAGNANPLAELPLPGDSALPGNSRAQANQVASPGPSGPDVPARGQDMPPYPGQKTPYEPPEPYELPAGPSGPVGQAGAYGAPPVPEAGYGPPGPQTHPADADDRLRVPPYQQQAPPYPAQVSPAPSPALAARVTAPFAALTKSKVRRPARPPRPAPPGPGAVKDRVAAATRTGNGPVASATRTGNVPRGAAPTRRAQLVLARIEPWSVMKFSFMISLVGWVVLFVAVAALYYVLSKLGVFHSIQSTISDVTSSKGSGGSDANGKWFSASRILGYTMLIGAVNVVLITALATVGAVIYNLVTHLAGGIEVTLKETD